MNPDPDPASPESGSGFNDPAQKICLFLILIPISFNDIDSRFFVSGWSGSSFCDVLCSVVRTLQAVSPHLGGACCQI